MTKKDIGRHYKEYEKEIYDVLDDANLSIEEKLMELMKVASQYSFHGATDIKEKQDE